VTAEPTLILVGGPPRVGKTTVAAQIGGALGCGWTGLDTIRTILKSVLPELDAAGAPGEPGSLTREARIFQPWFEHAARSLYAVHGTYVLEGVGFMPSHVDALPEWINRIAVFMGATRFDLETSLRTAGRNTWLNESPPEMQALVPAWIEGWSAELRAECEQLGYPFVDISELGFDTALHRVVEIVVAAAS